MKKLSLLMVVLIMISSCVTSKKYDELNALSDKHLSDRRDVEEKLAIITEERDDCLQAKEKLANDFSLIQSERDQLLTDKNQLENLLEEYKKLNDDLFSSKKSLLDEASSNQKILADKLALKEKELNAISAAQEVLDEILRAREAELNMLEEENQLQSNRIKELEDRLKEKDLALQNLKATISAALKGFSSDEISVEEKNGNLYVSLSEKLLFSSGSFAIDVKGKDAISKLGQVLRNQTDFNIVVEGHTDNDPFNGSGVLLDNWDLSVKRATSVVRILTQNGGVLPENVSASGRGEFIPINENSDPVEKAKNRRTEIILKPNLDRIMNLLNN